MGCARHWRKADRGQNRPGAAAGGLGEGWKWKARAPSILLSGVRPASSPGTLPTSHVVTLEGCARLCHATVFKPHEEEKKRNDYASSDPTPPTSFSPQRPPSTGARLCGGHALHAAHVWGQGVGGAARPAGVVARVAARGDAASGQHACVRSGGACGNGGAASHLGSHLSVGLGAQGGLLGGRGL